MSKVLIAALTDCSAELSRTILWRSGIERHWCPPLTDLGPIRSIKPDLIVIEAQGEVEPVREVLQRIRSASDVRRVSLVVLSRLSDPDADAVLRQSGANVVLSGAPVPVLWDVWLDHLLTVPLRQEARLQARCEVWSHTNPSLVPFLGWSVNVSLRGILLETQEKIEVGTKLDVSLRLPGEAVEIRITGQVVRYAGRSPAGHLCGLEFLVLRDESRERMRQFLDSVVIA